MLNVFRRHISKCSKFGSRSQDCSSRPKCPIHYEGLDGEGRKIKPRGLIDPISGRGIRDWNRAVEVIRELELPRPIEKPTRVSVSLEKAAEAFLASKLKRSPDTQRKIRLLTGRLISFAETKKKYAIDEIDLPTLVDFRNTWCGKDTSQRRDQEILRSFFLFCLKAKWVEDNPAAGLDPITVTTAQTDVFEHDEIRRILLAAQKFPDAFGRTDQAIARRVYAFVLVMRYTGLSIGDAAGLPKSHVRVPRFVIDAVNAAPHDSAEYFFWSGNGLIHTRASKWNARLRKVFVLAGVRLEIAEWDKKSLRSQSPRIRRAEKRITSQADPRWFRHTLARDLLENDIVTMTELAEILGNTEAVCRKHYSKWDRRRQAKIDEKLEKFWRLDPLQHDTSNSALVS
jgi:site-specific recombinase XerD